MVVADFQLEKWYVQSATYFTAEPQSAQRNVQVFLTKHTKKAPRAQRVASRKHYLCALCVFVVIVVT
jgi:hypothetical protein